MKRWIIVILLILTAGIAFSILRSRNSHETAPATTVGQKTQASELYYCPMHPHIKSEKPGKCPICHMDLQKMEGHEEDEVEEQNGKPQSTIEGRASFKLSPARQQLIGVTTTQVKPMELNHEIRASGRVAFDPELFTAIEEYRQALSSLSQMKDSSFSGLKEQSRALINSSKTRLRLLGLNDEQIKEVGRAKNDPMNLILPKGIAWIYAEVFEYEMANIKVGQKVLVEASSLNEAKTFSGKVLAISPVIDPNTRTFKVRAEVPDPQGTLKPDTFVNVTILVDVGTKLAIPEDSVLHSREKTFVFVVKDKGSFEPRLIVLGMKANDYYEVRSGLKEGETVVTSANFLIDSESKLQSVLKQMGTSTGSATTQQPSHQGHGQ